MRNSDSLPIHVLDGCSNSSLHMVVGQQMMAEREMCPTGMNRVMLYKSGV